MYTCGVAKVNIGVIGVDIHNGNNKWGRGFMDIYKAETIGTWRKNIYTKSWIVYVEGITWHIYTYTHDHFLDMLHVVNSYKKNHGLCIPQPRGRIKRIVGS